MEYKNHTITIKADGKKYIAVVKKPDGSDYYASKGKAFSNMLEAEKAAKKEIDDDIKKEETKKLSASDNPTVEPWLADPYTLKKELKHMFGKPDPISGIQSATDFYMEKKMNSEKFNEEVSKRLAKVVSPEKNFVSVFEWNGQYIVNVEPDKARQWGIKHKEIFNDESSAVKNADEKRKKFDSLPKKMSAPKKLSAEEKIESKLKRLSASWGTQSNGVDVLSGKGSDGEEFMAKVRPILSGSKYECVIWLSDKIMDKKEFAKRDEAKRYAQQYYDKYVK